MKEVAHGKAHGNIALDREMTTWYRCDDITKAVERLRGAVRREERQSMQKTRKRSPFSASRCPWRRALVW
jgi:hypothetical protein